MNNVKLGGKYKHYKGDLYEVIFVGRDSNSLDEVVIYKGLYNSVKFGNNPIWVRPLKEFLEEVEINGKIIKRFELIK